MREEDNSSLYSLRIISYNIHSFVNFDRLELLLAELGDQPGDLVVLTETWREETNEVFTTEYGHAWLGCGSTPRQHGVGFLLNKNTPIETSCACQTGWFLGRTVWNLSLRSFGVYMPHGGYDDEHVDIVFAQLEACMTSASRQRMHTILCGNFNADIGMLHMDDARETFEDANCRGICLRQ